MAVVIHNTTRFIKSSWLPVSVLGAVFAWGNKDVDHKIT